MTGQLTELMRDRADALDAPAFDFYGLVREGDRRVRRRRAALAGGLGALAVAAGLVAPLVVDGTDGRGALDPDLATAFGAPSPAYAVGSLVTVDGHRFDVGRPVHAFVQTSAGVVFSDAAGNVWAAAGPDPVVVGRVNPDGPRLVADGPRAAWVEPGDTPVFAVLNQDTGQVVRDPLGNVPSMATTGGGPDPAVVYAIDGTAVYVRDHAGAQVWDVATGKSRPLSANADSGTIVDVQAGQIVYVTRRDGSPPVQRLGTTLDNGVDLGVWKAEDLSPSGHYLMAEPRADVFRVLDTQTTHWMPTPEVDYDFFLGYAWLDRDHYAAVGASRPYASRPVDILTCTASTGACAVTAEGVGTLADGFTIPIGRDIGD
jgi:hypothetical protein